MTRVLDLPQSTEIDQTRNSEALMGTSAAAEGSKNKQQVPRLFAP